MYKLIVKSNVRLQCWNQVNVITGMLTYLKTVHQSLNVWLSKQITPNIDVTKKYFVYLFVSSFDVNHISNLMLITRNSFLKKISLLCQNCTKDKYLLINVTYVNIFFESITKGFGNRKKFRQNFSQSVNAKVSFSKQLKLLERKYVVFFK